MKFKAYLFPFLRISFGLLLILISMYDVIKYNLFLNRLDKYLNAASIFEADFMPYLASLVPFVKFIIGFFIVLEMFKENVLKVSIGFFAFFGFFLLDASCYYCSLIYFGYSIISLVLLKNDKHKLTSLSFGEDPYRFI